jgi:hypothetical protein
MIRHELGSIAPNLITGAVGIAGIAGSNVSAGQARKSAAENMQTSISAEDRHAKLSEKRRIYANCYNPTEPGAWDDDITTKWGVDSAGYGWNQYPWLGPSTTAILAPAAYPSATSVTTQTRLAMWLANGEKDSYCPAGATIRTPRPTGTSFLPAC